MSKGSSRRPMQIPPEEFEQRWAETFGGSVYGTPYVDRADGADSLEFREAYETMARLVKHQARAMYS